MSKKFADEPKFIFPLTTIDITRTLNWYNSNCDYVDSIAWGQQYILKKYNKDVSTVITKEHLTFGNVSRMLNNGCILPDTSIKWHTDKCHELIAKLDQKEITKPKEIPKKLPKDNTDSIICELESLLDQQIILKFKHKTNLRILTETRNFNKENIRNHFSKKLQELSDIPNDQQLLEGYSNFTKSEINIMIALFRDIIETCKDVIKISKKSIRKKSKPKNVLKHFKYCQEFNDLNLKSIDPIKIIGAQAVWIFNTKYKKLTRLTAKSVDGLNIHRSSIINYDESQSCCKILRKPSEVLPDILVAGKIFLRQFFNTIKTKECKLTNRINEDILILRIQ